MNGSAFGMVPFQVLTDTDLGHAAVRLYGILAAYANRVFECWPSQETLAKDMGVKDARNVRTVLKELEEAGYIERVLRHNGDGMRAGCIYRLLIQIGKTQQNRTGLSASGRPDSQHPVAPDSQHPDSEHTKEHTKEDSPPAYAGPPQGGVDAPGAAAPELVIGTSPPAEPEARRRAPDRGSFLPDDWRLSQQDIAFAHGKGLADAEIRREGEKFHSYWTGASGRNARKRNWQATWRTWVLNLLDRRGNGLARLAGGGGYRTPSTHGPKTSCIDRLFDPVEPQDGGLTLDGEALPWNAN
jgi:hypothetical protein